MNGCWLDKTYCMSDGCTNECGRKMPEDWKEKIPVWKPMSYAKFCEERKYCGHLNLLTHEGKHSNGIACTQCGLSAYDFNVQKSVVTYKECKENLLPS